MTGGSGYIGSAVAQDLLERGFDVETLDILPQRVNLRELGVPHRICDLRDYDALKDCITGTEVVIHAAILQIPRINEERRAGYETNVVGTANLCKLIDASSAKGMVLAGTWHVIGESGLNGVISEGFGYRPDRVEDRARLYALAKIAQELIVRLHGEFSDSMYGILRLGTVLGEGMPQGTAASIFVDQALKGEDLTPFSHSMYRPIAYVSIQDVVEGFHRFARKMLSEGPSKRTISLDNVVNLLYPEPITIMQLAEAVCTAARKVSKGELNPRIQVVDTGLPSLFDENEWKEVKFDLSRSRELLGFDEFISPPEELERIIRSRWGGAV